MTARALRVGIFFLLVTALAKVAYAGDPYLRWYTIRTPYFRVHYHSGLERLAQRTANLAEAINARLMPELGWQPSEVTHILLTDDSDDANGSATGLPYNTVRLFVTAPDDMSPLGDYDDWMVELVTHEYTHILHIDNVTGIPAIIDARLPPPLRVILGKSLVPNQIQPHWILEGLAVTMESAHTSAGRERSTLFDMFVRADVLEDNFAGLDQISHDVRRWPQGNLWYLYGGRFIAWIESVYGPETFKIVAHEYGQNPIPWGINRTIRRATGRTYPELYAAWKLDLERRYAAQVEEVKKRGIRQGTRLTHHGGDVSSPRFVPPCARRSSAEEILYFRDDSHSMPGFYRLPLAARDRSREDESELFIRTAGSDRQASFDPDCGVVFDSVVPSRRRYRFNDIHYQPAGTDSPSGLRGSRNRWTTGGRARYPDISPDGRRLVFVTNHGGTSTLRIADVDTTTGISRMRALVPSARFEQAYKPRFSPDGQHVAYSVWTSGGYRDIRIVDVATGAFVQVTRDRAIDQQPSWSPDGKRLFFTSDRSGIANVYAYDIATKTLLQVTNVINGAYMPEVSPDGKTLVYVGYTHEGFDLFSLPLDESQWLDAPPPPTNRPLPQDEPPSTQWPVESYNPWPTLRPRTLDISYGQGTFGNALTVTVHGSDIVGLHGATARMTYQTELEQFTGSLAYSYNRLPFFFNATAFRDVFPRRSADPTGAPEVLHDENLGVTTGTSYALLGDFDTQWISLAYTLGYHDTNIPVGRGLDPFAPIAPEPFEGILASVHLGWSYDATFRSLWSISEERGYSLSLSAEIAAPELGSEETLRTFRGRATGYVEMPWLRHHVLAATIGGGVSGGSYPSRGFFFTGGFTPENPIDTFQSDIRQGAFVLRGYAPARFIGRQYDLTNIEYRFPIWYADHGVSTLPVFFNTLSGVFFTDIGGAFDEIDRDDPLSDQHIGVGAELRTNLTLGYDVTGTLRLGWAKGFDDEAIPGSQVYAVVASSF